MTCGFKMNNSAQSAYLYVSDGILGSQRPLDEDLHKCTMSETSQVINEQEKWVKQFIESIFAVQNCLSSLADFNNV